MRVSIIRVENMSTPPFLENFMEGQPRLEYTPAQVVVGYAQKMGVEVIQVGLVRDNGTIMEPVLEFPARLVKVLVEP